jgi:hypothetical protein
MRCASWREPLEPTPATHTRSELSCALIPNFTHFQNQTLHKRRFLEYSLTAGKVKNGRQSRHRLGTQHTKSGQQLRVQRLILTHDNHGGVAVEHDKLGEGV